MLGALIGDICGAVYEFDNNKTVQTIQLFREGCYPTDDSVMTIAVGKALMDSYGMEMPDVYDALINSMHYYGNLFPKAGYGGTFRHWLKEYRRSPYDSWGNGSGMRVSAAGWLKDSLEETRALAALTAMPTHNHPEGIKGAEAIASCIFLARKGKTKEEIKAYVEDNFYKLDFTIAELRPSYSFDVSCQGSVPQAIEAFLEGTDFENVIKVAISLGGDSDTIAAMAGAIAESYYGIPENVVMDCFDVLKDGGDGVRVYNNSVLKDEILRFWTFLKRHHLDLPKEAKLQMRV